MNTVLHASMHILQVDYSKQYTRLLIAAWYPERSHAVMVQVVNKVFPRLFVNEYKLGVLHALDQVSDTLAVTLATQPAPYSLARLLYH